MLTITGFQGFINISLKGSGSYNLVVKNSGGNEVYRFDNSQTSGGATAVQWPGNGVNGSPAPDGQYQLNLTTGQNGQELSGCDGSGDRIRRVSLRHRRHFRLLEPRCQCGKKFKTAFLESLT